MPRLVPWLWRLTAAAGLTLLVVTTTARLTLLDASFDTRAIGAANAYERVYTQVLPSPEAQAAIRQALAGLPVDPSYLTTNVRVLLPPPVLEEVVRQAITSYVRTVLGRPRTGDLSSALQPIIDNVAKLVQELAPGAVAAAPQLRPGSFPAFNTEVRRLVAELATGEIDLSLPTIKLRPDNVDQVAAIMVAGLPPQRSAALQSQIRTLLASGDLSGAFALIVPAYLDSAAVRNLRAAASSGAGLALQSVPAGWAQAAPHPVLPLGVGWLTLIGLVLSGAGLVAGWVMSGRRAHEIATTLLVAVVFVLLIGFAVHMRVVDPLREVVRSGDLNPPSQQLVVDIDNGLRHGVVSVFLELTTVLAVLGLAAGAVAWLTWLRTEDSRRIRVSAIGAGTLTAATLVVLAAPLGPTPMACNGSPLLCDRPYNQVSYLTSHNAMASSDRGFLGANQDPSITAQLDNGVRGLMLDLHYWTTPEEAEPYLASLDPQTRAAWAPLVTSFEPHPGVWLCHEFCQIGADAAVTQLTQLRRWLADNPDDVVTLILEDDVSASDVQATIHAAGLDPWLLTPPKPGRSWPTLGTMVEQHHTLVAFTQYAHLTTGPIRNFYSMAAETPYAADKSSALTCLPGRGPATAPLFLVNNWITRGIPSRATALTVDRQPFLLDRIRRCQDVRGIRATFIAVDFAQVGSPLQVVDTLNGLAAR